MAKLAKYPALRWAAPVVAAALVVGVPLAASTTALAEPVLPARSAEQLLVDVQGVRPQPLSGEVSQVTNLGLPELPGFASPTVSDASLGSLLTLASGTHTWRLWTDGDDASRVALVDGRNETDVIRNGSDVWVWSSADRTAVHSTLPDHSASSTAAEEAAKKASSPAEVAADIIKAVEPTTTVTIGRAATVAGRPVYQLILTPKQTGTKVGNVVVSIDSETKVPLRVQVASSDGATAIDVGFTSVSFAAPDASTLTFTAPAGTTVTEKPIDKPSGSTEGKTSAKDTKAAKPTVIGTGWTTVVVSKAGSAATAEQKGSAEADETASALLEQLPKVSGSWGSGRLLNGTLVSVVLSDDGRVAAGAVSPDALYDALAG